MNKLDADRLRYNAFKEKENELKRLNDKIKLYEYTTKLDFFNKCDTDIINAKESLTVVKDVFSTKVKSSEEVEGKIKILKSRVVSEVRNEYNKMKNLIFDLVNNLTQNKNRMESLNKEVLQTRKEKHEHDAEVETKKKDI